MLAQAAERSQLIVVTHAAILIATLREFKCDSITLEKGLENKNYGIGGR